MQHFFDLFSFNIWEIIALLVLFILTTVQLYYYFAYYKLPYSKALKKDNQFQSITNNSKVSVIIASENEAIRLEKILPEILEQNHPNFEVIVISDGSTDETEELLDSLKVKYKNLYSTYVPYSNDKKFGRRKLAYTLGAKAANGDILLFTEPHSKPISKDWITLMTQDISNDIEIVIGFSYFLENDTFFNRIARFDNLLFSIQYLSKALKNSAYTGVYRNVAFKKDLFFKNKGFASHLALENGEDVFINQIVNEHNTVTCIHPNGFTEADIDNYSLWKKTKRNYSIAKSNFKNNDSHFFRLESVSRVLFYTLCIALAVYSVAFKAWGVLIITFLLFAIRLTTQLVIINKASKHFNSGKFYSSIIWVDILQPVYNLSFRTRNKKIKAAR